METVQWIGDVVVPFIAASLGVVFLLVAKPFAKRIVEDQNKTTVGWMHRRWGFKFLGERDERGTVWLIRLLGVYSIGAGIWGIWAEFLRT
jgi:hypothetical protein